MLPYEVLCLKSVSLKYATTLAVNNLDLTIYSGEILGLLGPNGCGKSTTLNAIAGNHELDSGCILLEGKSHSQQPLFYRSQIGFVPQELAFYEEFSPFDNLSFFAKLYGIPKNILPQRVNEVLSLVRLDDRAHQPSRSLSGGMKRRLNLACALLHKPKLLLLDEPTVGLDPHSREAVFSCLNLLKEQGCAIIYTSHYLEEIFRLCDKVGIMSQGNLLFLGSIQEFQTRILKKKSKVSLPIPNYRFSDDCDSLLHQANMQRSSLAEDTHSLEQYLIKLSEIKAA